MPSGYEVLLSEVLDRMKAAGANWPSASAIRRAHRTPVPRDASGGVVNAIHVIDGNDEPDSKNQNADCAMRKCNFTLALFVRSDAGPTAADPMKLEAMRRMSPDTAAWPDGFCVDPGRISVDDEVADADAIRVDMEFSASYPTAGEWTL